MIDHHNLERPFPLPDAIFYVPPVDLSRPDTHEPTSPGYPDVVLIPPDDRGANAPETEDTSVSDCPQPEAFVGSLVSDAIGSHEPHDHGQEAAGASDNVPQEDAPPPPTDNSGGGGDKPPQGPDASPSPTDEPPERGEWEEAADDDTPPLPVVTEATKIRVLNDWIRDPDMPSSILEQWKEDQPELARVLGAFFMGKGETPREISLMVETAALLYGLLEEQALVDRDGPTVDSPESTTIPAEAPVAGDSAEAHEADTPGVFLDFRQPFDATRTEIPLDEQQEAGRIFGHEAGVFVNQDIAATFVNQDIVATRIAPGMLAAEIVYRKRILDVVVLKIDKSVSVHLQDIQPDGTYGESATYLMGKDGEVRRVDKGVPTPDEIIAQQLERIEMETKKALSGADDPAQMHSDFLRKLSNATDTYDTEATLGINNLPVGLEEVNNVVALLNDLRRRFH